MSTPASEPTPAFQVRWPDGGIYVNRKGESRLTEEEAKATAPRIGGTWRHVTEAARAGVPEAMPVPQGHYCESDPDEDDGLEAGADDEEDGCPGCAPGNDGGDEEPHLPGCGLGPLAYKRHPSGCGCPDSEGED